MRAMILAAGRGERLRPLTDTLPKPLIEVGGQSLISRHLHRLAQAGFNEIVINLAHLGGLIREQLGDGAKWGLSIQYSEEPKGALNSGGGIRQALHLLGDTPFAVINADIHSDYPLGRLRAIKCNYLHMIMVTNPSHNQKGDFAVSAGRLDPDGKPRFTFSGISVYNPRFFDSVGEGNFSVVPMMTKAAKQGKVTAEIYRGDWHDVGTIERLESLIELSNHTN